LPSLYDCDAYGNTIVYEAAGAGGDWFADDARSIYSESPAGSCCPTCEFIFTGRRFDPETSDADTQMYFYRARYYSPTLGRFISRDPIDYDGGMNLYEYVGGMAVGAVDANGWFTIYVHGVKTGGTSQYETFRKEAYKSVSGKGPKHAAIDLVWAQKDGKTWYNPLRYASDSIGKRKKYTEGNSMWSYGMAGLQWAGVDKLKKTVKELRAIIASDPCLKGETINIVAHSQGTLVTLAALQEGMVVDNVIFMGSPMDKEIVEDATHNTDIAAGAKNATSLVNLWSTSDDAVRPKGGIGGYGLPKNKIAGKISDVELTGVDHTGDEGWWAGTWLGNKKNLSKTKKYVLPTLYTQTDYSKMAETSKKTLSRIQTKASKLIPAP